jgi:hypothetical protein
LRAGLGKQYAEPLSCRHCRKIFVSQSNPLRKEVAVLEAYRAHVAERAALGIPPLPLSKQQTTELVGPAEESRRKAKKPLWSS